MSGEKNLRKLLSSMKPVLNKGNYVFCTTNEVAQLDMNDVVMLFKEKEGITIIIEKQIADQQQLHYSFVASWISLTVHSSLDAVGLTAAFTKALTVENISCNVVAGYYHDHLFVNRKDAEKAMSVLNSFSVI
ncbi:MAG: ACT domain-containing protein [Cyclobacteriaceae bacterium]|jgi:hypothetical protein